ncbi:Rec8 like protein-domain-containing protein [Phyllosticta paracitricarpa]
MFYSHEGEFKVELSVEISANCNPKSSRLESMVWLQLVATLGSRSSLKKVNRKAILEVNVPKACETILAPEAPMALRLQSNLLYGVSRVYLQQCTYVLADCQNAQNSIRASLHVVRAAALDPEAGRSRPEQLLLQDDPSFLPEFALEPLDLAMDISAANASFTSGSNTLSPHASRRSRSITLDENLGGPFGGLNIPTSDTGAEDFGGFVVPSDDGAGIGAHGGSSHIQDDGFDPNADFAFDADGNLIEHDLPQQTHQTPRVGSASQSIAGGSARPLEREGIQQQEDTHVDDRMDIDLPEYGGEMIIPDGEPLSSVREHQSSPAAERSVQDAPVQSSSPVRVVAQRQRKSRVIPLDTTMELRNTELLGWQKNYLQNMAQAAQHKHSLRAAAQAKKNAEYWVLGLGIGGIGAIAGSTGIPGPLDMFKGEALLRTLGVRSEPTATKKRGHQLSAAEDEPQDRRVRQRSEEGEFGRGNEDDAVFYGDEDIEVAREAAEEIQSQLSQHFPWSATASARASSVAASARNALGLGGQGFPSSVAGPSSIGVAGSLGRRTSRMISASPLHGRGAQRGLEAAEHEHEQEEDLEETLGAFDSDMAIDGDEFELYGAAAGVDTQTANQSQFAHAQFDRQIVQFGEFIFETMQKKKADEDEEAGQVGKDDELLFGELIRPQSNTKAVAAQGFMHLLGLATQGRITVQQNEPYSDISISLPFAGSL